MLKRWNIVRLWAAKMMNPMVQVLGAIYSIFAAENDIPVRTVPLTEYSRKIHK